MSSDPYVLASVGIGEPSKDWPCKKTKTKIITRNPVWDEALVFSGPKGFLEPTTSSNAAASASRLLRLQVFDWDSVLKAPTKVFIKNAAKDDNLGEVYVDLEGVFEQPYALLGLEHPLDLSRDRTL